MSSEVLISHLVSVLDIPRRRVLAESAHGLGRLLVHEYLAKEARYIAISSTERIAVHSPTYNERQYDMCVPLNWELDVFNTDVFSELCRPVLPGR